LDESLPLLLSVTLMPPPLVLLYNSFILFFRIGISIAANWNTKAKKWLLGRKDIWKELEVVSKNDHVIWIHASSAGEFEQAKPVIERLKASYPSYKILVTFFSPSGYEAAKNYTAADYKFYLPADTASNARRFVQLINPKLVVFVKYDFWYYYLHTINKNQIPLLLISSVFRKEQAFFKWFGGFYKKMLFFFSQIFVQDQSSLAILKENGITNSQISGDTRFDRVIKISSGPVAIPFIKNFIGNSQVIIAGSTWPGDEAVLRKAVSASKTKLIIAPHEVDKSNIQRLQEEFTEAILYSELKEETIFTTQNVLIIDNVGMLSRLYHYATITYVGGGFTNDGIHNILEAAVHAKPVLFGPNYKKYSEAPDLIEHGGGFSASTYKELQNIIERLLENKAEYQLACEKSIDYIRSKTGATEKILNYIQEKRLLTS
jgi:3-deoxy-D-manno-octulosonic-acid transferase